MHGRLKVRTTAEQAEAKRKERQKKLEFYLKVNGRVNAKRKNEELDEEAMSLTCQLLIANPDFYTLWNYRREILEHFKKHRGSEQLKELCTKELSFLESCLPVNPKSYGIWHHRSWMMLFMPGPEWKKELQLCNVYLSYDERNFHCWDYRRFVAKHAQISPQDEFHFTSEKIKENFSNYSSWHYRSKLLPKIHPASEGDEERIEEGALLKEFQLVQNAFFTDPNDQSAWFYHRWLLGRAKNQLAMLQAYVRRYSDTVCLYVLFNQPVKQDAVFATVVYLNEAKVQTDWQNPLNKMQPSCIWIAAFKVPEKEPVHLTSTCKELNINVSLILQELETERWQSCFDQMKHSFRSELTVVHHSFLENELESCLLLLEEEPDNKWTILTIVLLMRAINPMKYSDAVANHLKTLAEIDHYRQGYYNDLDSKYKLENSIETHFTQHENDDRELSRVIKLNNMNLSCLYHMDRLLLLTDIDLSHNRLRSLDGCSMLQCARRICADNNDLRVITMQGELSLPHLEVLSVINNHINDISCLNALQGCKSLKELNVKDNPIEKLSGWEEQIRKAIPSLVKLNGKDL